MPVMKNVLNSVMKWGHLTIALQESLNLGVQQNHRYEVQH